MRQKGYSASDFTKFVAEMELKQDQYDMKLNNYRTIASSNVTCAIAIRLVPFRVVVVLF